MAPLVLSKESAPTSLSHFGAGMLHACMISLVHSLYLLSPGVKDGRWTVLQLVEALG